MKYFIRVILCLLAVGFCALCLLGTKVYKGNCVVREGVVYIPTGSDFGALTDSLESGGRRIKYMGLFKAYARRIGLDKNVRGGCYRLREGQTFWQAARMFGLGEQTPVTVTFNNVRTSEQLAGKLARQIEADSASVLAVLRSDSVAALYGFTPQTFMAMFIPDTYEVWWTTSPGELMKRMYREYSRFWTAARDARRDRSGLSRLEVMTLASIVWEETRKPDEMPTVAGVYINRLRKGMPLQADPTVKYAVGDFTLRRILNSHLKTPSPYNTYLNKGLPPSPIAMPSVDAIESVLDFREHDYLYFCARPTFDGYHNFAATYAEHLRNARAYTAELNRRRIYK